MEVLVFKTSKDSFFYLNEISVVMAVFKNKIVWNADLEDCDKILRVETNEISGSQIIYAMQTAGFICEELE